MSVTAPLLAESSTNKFFVDVNNVLGFEYQSYISSITALSLSKPDEYYKMRAETLEKVRNGMIHQIYGTIFNCLHLGKDVHNNAIGTLGKGPYIPRYPGPKINDLTIALTSELSDNLEKVIDIILPQEFITLANKSLTLKGRASLVSDK